MKTRVLSEDGVPGREEFMEYSGMISEVAGGARPEGRYVNVILISPEKMEELNLKYKGRSGPAEILTFPYDSGDFVDIDSSLEGEIYLCWPQITMAAEERDVDPQIYLLRLVVHGIFHLSGYSHADPENARIMEQAEMDYLIPILGRETAGKLF